MSNNETIRNAIELISEAQEMLSTGVYLHATQMLEDTITSLEDEVKEYYAIDMCRESVLTPLVKGLVYSTDGITSKEQYLSQVAEEAYFALLGERFSIPEEQFVTLGPDSVSIVLDSDVIERESVYEVAHQIAEMLPTLPLEYMRAKVCLGVYEDEELQDEIETRNFH